MATKVESRRTEYVEGRDRRDAGARFSIPSILAVVCAFASFPVGALLGALLAAAAIFLGVLGAVLAVSPRIRGGVVSVLSILAGFLGIAAALVKLLLLFF